MNKDISILFNTITDTLKDNNILFSKVENSEEEIYLISEKKLNFILTRIFELCSKKEYCFSIIRDEYQVCKILLFDDTNIKEFKLDYRSKNASFLEKKYFEFNCETLKKLRIIPLIGPDGVGKTTLLLDVKQSLKDDVITKRFKKIVRRSIIYNICHPINKNIIKIQMGKKPEKDQHDDLNAKLIILAGILYYPYMRILSLLKNKIIFVDRFFQDALLEDISFREKETHLRQNWKFLLKFIPQTLWNIHLDAKSEIILERKDELSSDDIKKYRELNFEIYLEKPSLIYSYINTSNELSVCSKIVSYIGNKNGIFKNMEEPCQY